MEDEVDLDKINIGCKVRILDLEYNEELEYKIVGFFISILSLHYLRELTMVLYPFFTRVSRNFTADR